MSALPGDATHRASRSRSDPAVPGCDLPGLEERAPVTIPISSVVSAAWLRVKGANDDHVQALAGVQDPLPPIVVYRPSMQVIDGLHRLRAAILRGDTHIEATFFEGTEDTAFLLAVRLNSKHGLPLSLADRSAAATRIMRSFPEWSDRAVASLAGLSDKTVAAIRRRSSAEIPQLDERVGVDGRARPLNAAAGRIRAGNLIAQKPNATLREIARESGISLGTARDVRERLRRGQEPTSDCRGRRAELPTVPVPKQAEGPGTGEAARLVAARPAPVLRMLCKDPSLRYSEAGRTVLRLLALHSISNEEWKRLSASVPPYWIDAVAELARDCASSWQQFARQLEEQSERKLASGS